MIKIISFSKFTNIQSQSASRYTPQKGNCRKTETRQTECTEKIKIINPLKRFLICGCCCWILLLHLPSSLSFCQPFGNRCPCIAHTQRCQVGFPRCVGSSPCRPICYIYSVSLFFFFAPTYIICAVNEVSVGCHRPATSSYDSESGDNQLPIVISSRAECRLCSIFGEQTDDPGQFGATCNSCWLPPPSATAIVNWANICGCAIASQVLWHSPGPILYTYIHVYAHIDIFAFACILGQFRVRDEGKQPALWLANLPPNGNAKTGAISKM